MPRGYRERPDFGLWLGVGERTELGSDAARDGRRFAARLEAGEVGPVAPREGTAQPHSGLDRGVVHDVDRAFVVGRSLAIAREVSEIAARREHGSDAWYLGDLVGVLEALERFNHQNQH